MKLEAPAKVNLHFRILGKRDDGFHEVETRMAPLSLSDTVQIEPQPGNALRFTCSDPSLPTDASNLVVRAVELFRRETGRTDGLSIHLEKHIPHGAGLAGGSSDAAAALLGLDRLLQTGLGRDALAAMASELGSDVAFFLQGSAALCKGRGERVEAAPLDRALPLLLIKPEFGISTPWAYGNWAGSRRLPDFPYDPQPFGWGELYNDLERAVFEKYLVLGALKRWLLDQPETAGALMSGSGSTVFAVLHDAGSGPALRDRTREEFGASLWTSLCSTL